MNYNWYYIFNSISFTSLDLVSKTYTLLLNNIGQVDVLVTQGSYLGITYDDIFLPLNMSAKNPFEFEDHAIYVDENQNVWLGIKV